jgi:hypothetical protein
MVIGMCGLLQVEAAVGSAQGELSIGLPSDGTYWGLASIDNINLVHKHEREWPDERQRAAALLAPQCMPSVCLRGSLLSRACVPQSSARSRSTPPPWTHGTRGLRTTLDVRT